MRERSTAASRRGGSRNRKETHRTSRPEVVIANPVCTAIGTYGGTLKNTSAPDLGATAIRETLKRAGLTPEKVETVVMGQVVQAGAKMNPARQVAIGTGSPGAAPALTVTPYRGVVRSAFVEMITWPSLRPLPS